MSRFDFYVDERDAIIARQKGELVDCYEQIARLGRQLVEADSIMREQAEVIASLRADPRIKVRVVTPEAGDNVVQLFPVEGVK